MFTLQELVCAAALAMQPGLLFAQQAPPEQHPIDKRIFGVLPNYRTADGSAPYAPISAKRKFYIARKDSFDYPIFFLSGIFSAFHQLENQPPEYGQGLKGFGKRYAASFGDLSIGNYMAEGLYPALLRQDPRYFRKGADGGSAWKRTGYALTRVLVNRTDKGNWSFNASEWFGNGTAVAISNLYYPANTRNVSDNVERLGVQVGTDAFSNILKEFWPDWKRKLSKKKS